MNKSYFVVSDHDLNTSNNSSSSCSSSLYYFIDQISATKHCCISLVKDLLLLFIMINTDFLNLLFLLRKTCKVLLTNTVIWSRRTS